MRHAQETDSSCASGEQVHWARRGVYALLAAVRPDAVALVDAFGFEDYLLNSALGRRDGDVYRWSSRPTGHELGNPASPADGSGSNPSLMLAHAQTNSAACRLVSIRMNWGSG